MAAKILQSSKTVYASIDGSYIGYNTFGLVGGSFTTYYDTSTGVMWDGNSFSYKVEKTSYNQRWQTLTYECTIEIKGTISSDAKQILELNYNAHERDIKGFTFEDFYGKEYWFVDSEMVTISELTAKNIPLTQIYDSMVCYQGSQACITSARWSQTCYAGGGDPHEGLIKSPLLTEGEAGEELWTNTHSLGDPDAYFGRERIEVEFDVEEDENVYNTYNPKYKR